MSLSNPDYSQRLLLYLFRIFVSSGTSVCLGGERVGELWLEFPSGREANPLTYIDGTFLIFSPFDCNQFDNRNDRIDQNEVTHNITYIFFFCS